MELLFCNILLFHFRLYHIEVVGISALWRVFLGKRNNILKSLNSLILSLVSSTFLLTVKYFFFLDRIESHDYTNPQLYLATMFFATLLFILPTVLTYYTVFASVGGLVFLYFKN